MSPSTRTCLWTVVLLLAPAPACTYLKYASIQAEYARLQDADPSQRNLRHMIERPNIAVIGRTVDTDGRHQGSAMPVAVAAFSSRFQAHELVAVTHDVGTGTHFGLDLPAGEFEILALMDLDGDGRYAGDEVIGAGSLQLAEGQASKVQTRFVIELGAPVSAAWTIDIEVEASGAGQRSLFYPAGTIRALSDPIFAAEMITLGLYDPAAFFERAPTLFYALEEDLSFKIPVIFVHGAGGSARGFDAMVQQLDRARFKPWFFHYPSGGDLDQLGELFYSIFLSGDAIAFNEFVPTVIVAHSMGGLIVRRALNELGSSGSEPRAIEFLSLATPFAGHPSARDVGDASMLILPSWRDLDPASEFLADLFERPLAAAVTHHLFYAFNNDAMVKLGENSDGVVPLSSQLHPPAQQQSSRQLGLDTTHVGILHDPAAMAAVMRLVHGVEADIPALHLQRLLEGGFVVSGDDYSEFERYVIRHYGRYFDGLASGELRPLDAEQERLVPMLRGAAEPTFPSAVAFRKWLANGRR